MLRFFGISPALLVCVIQRVWGQAQVNLGATPLAIRSPYLNAWLDTRNDTNIVSPSFWDLTATLGWTGLVRVDGSIYKWLGQGGNVTTLSTSISPTRSILAYKAGPINLNVTFFTPIEPSSLAKQSFPFVYLYVDVSANDESSHSIQLYADVTGAWMSSNQNDQITWNSQQRSESLIHSMQLATVDALVENAEMAEDGALYFSMKASSNLTWQTGQENFLITQFATTGKLSNTSDTSFRAINNDSPSLAIALDIGTGNQTPSSVVWALGFVRNTTVRFFNGQSSEDRVPFFFSEVSNIEDGIDSFLQDFPAAESRATTLDNKIVSDGSNVSTQYTDLLSLSLRQVFGAMDITIPQQSNGQWDTSDVKFFMKEMGVGRRVNPVEDIYAAFPAFLYVNASWGELLLRPLLQYQNSSQYTNPYAAPDIGNSYPVASGNSTNTEFWAVESSSNMIIMLLAHAMKTGDGTIISQHYDMIKGWADYLVQHSLYPNGISSDGIAQSGIANLAIKGIIAVDAMSKISDAAGLFADRDFYAGNAANFTTAWTTLALLTDHVTSTYGDASSGGMIYNLYADRLLGLGLVSDSVYAKQTAYYGSQIAASDQFGFAFDTHSVNVNAPWTMFTAATCTNTSVRDQLITAVHNRAFEKSSNVPFPSLYNVANGSTVDGSDSGSLGAVFSLLALNVPNSTFTVTSTGSTSSHAKSSSKSNAGAIAGGVVGGIACLVVILGALLYMRKRTDRNSQVKLKFELDGETTAGLNYTEGTQNMGQTVTPFIVPPSPMAYSSTEKSLMPDHTARATDERSTYIGEGSTYASGSQRPSSIAKGGSPGPSASFPVPTSPVLSSAYTDEVMHSVRDEVMQLRQEMAAIRASTAVGNEPPPVYNSVS